MRLIGASRGGRNADKLAPGAESGVACGTVLVGGQAVSTELEVVMDAGVGGQKPLAATSWLELANSFMAVLCMGAAID